MSFERMQEITVVSSRDGSREPSLAFIPERKERMPLVIGLHTWSFGRANQAESLLPLCEERGWALLLPEFRGTNCTGNPRATEACASVLARQDVLDACDYLCGQHPIDRDLVFVHGGSGGGHMALMLAAYAPERWLAVSSWCPITDLAVWHGQNANYAAHIAACCGGRPGANDAVDREYRDRSPLFAAEKIARAHLAVWHGRGDTSVPYTHTLKLALKLEALRADRFYFSIFDGTHEIRHHTAFEWFDRIIKTNAKTDNVLTG